MQNMVFSKHRRGRARQEVLERRKASWCERRCRDGSSSKGRRNSEDGAVWRRRRPWGVARGGGDASSRVARSRASREERGRARRKDDDERRRGRDGDGASSRRRAHLRSSSPMTPAASNAAAARFRVWDGRLRRSECNDGRRFFPSLRKHRYYRAVGERKRQWEVGRTPKAPQKKSPSDIHIM